jgi:acyl carrier protein
MSTQDTLARIEGLMRDLFDEYEGPITAATSAEDIGQWDSLAHIQLVVLVEQEFGMKFNTTQIQQLNNLGDMIAVIDARETAG